MKPSRFDIHCPPPAWVAGALLPSWLYRIPVTLRSRLYRQGWFTTFSLPCPVVSVGNLTVGGTGKTPVVRFLAGWLRDHGHRPAILSRGYGRRPAPELEAEPGLLVASDGRGRIIPPEHAGDEPHLLAMELPDVPVLCCPDRHRAGCFAVERLGANLLLLDDGFQHLAVRRDFNLLLLDGRHRLGNGRLLPAGPLREPAGAVRRADAILVTRLPAGAEGRRCMTAIARLAGPVPLFSSDFQLSPEFFTAAGETLSAGQFTGQPVLAAAGIARPGQFFDMLTGAGFRLAARLSLPDHCRYGENIKEELRRLIRRHRPAALLVTRKDLVKLSGFSPGIPVAAPDMQLNLHQPGLLELLARRIALPSPPDSPAEMK